MGKTEAYRAIERERHRDRYHADPTFREKVKESGRRSAQKLHDELLANPKDPRHGTTTGYFKGRCKCRKCKNAMNAYDRERRARVGGESRRHRWSPEIQVRLSDRDARIRAMAKEGYGVTRAAIELGLHRDTTARLVRSMGLSQRFFRNIKATHCQNGHKFTRTNTHVRPSGARECRTCRRTYARSWRQIHAGTLRRNDHRHGSRNGYGNYSCRCSRCTLANSEACKEWRARRKEATRNA